MMNKYYAFSLESSKPADHEALDGLIMFASLFNEAVGATRAIDALYDCETPSQVTEKIKLICTLGKWSLLHIDAEVTILCL